MIGLILGIVIGWLGCSLAIGCNRDDYTHKIAVLRTEINNLKGESHE